MKERIARRSAGTVLTATLPKNVLNLLKDIPIGLKVGGILRQIAKACARRLDRFAHAGDLWARRIIDHHDIVSLGCWHEVHYST